MGEETDNNYDLRWWGLTDKGPFRKNNEDAFLLMTFDQDEARLLGKEGEAGFELGDFIFAVSDGMGGANAGEFASRIAVQAITQRFPKHYSRHNPDTAEDHIKVMEKVFEQIHAEMVVMGQHYEECRGMGATLSMLWLGPWKAHFCHVGDSRIYHLKKDGTLAQVTEDHTHVGWLFREGKLTEREARYHEGRHSLQMVMGGRQTGILPQVGTFDVEPGDRFVLCSDGLIEGLWDSSIQRLMTSPPPRLAEKDPAKRLMEEALYESGRDNTTVVVVETMDSGH